MGLAATVLPAVDEVSHDAANASPTPPGSPRETNQEHHVFHIRNRGR